MGVRLPTPDELENLRKSLEKQARRKLELEAAKIALVERHVTPESASLDAQEVEQAQSQDEPVVDQPAQPKVLNNFKPKRR